MLGVASIPSLDSIKTSALPPGPPSGSLFLVCPPKLLGENGFAFARG